MSDDTPTRIGSYEITREIGRGGMGVVYLARDTKLHRDVAIKCLPDELSGDPGRLARLEREAKTLASLNHPNIASIHGIEEIDSKRYLVLEYVEGETLGDRLDRGALPLDEALEIAIEIASGVEAAHEAGVIHRDLKPDNIKLTPEGKVKVLDFGLACRAASTSAVEAMDSPTVVGASPTIPGAILGTAAYMSPEQARGRQVDRRTDIWSFGVILYEMLTGSNPFVGETAGDSIGAVLHKELELDRLPSDTPPMVHHVLRRCLARDKAQRYRDIEDAALDLTPTSVAPIAVQPRTRGLRFGWVLAALFAVLFVLAALFSPGVLRREPKPLPTRVSVVLESGETVQALAEMLRFTISRDGRTLAYCTDHDGVVQLRIRHLADREGRVLQGTDAAHNPFFSPDGQWVGYFAVGGLFKVSIRGGAPIEITMAPDSRSGVWLDDDTIVYAPSFGGPLMRVPASGGAPSRLTTLDESRNERTHRWPDVSPSGEWISFTVGKAGSPSDYNDADIEAVSLKTGERRLLVHGGTMARWVPSGHLIYFRHGALFAVPIDLETATVLGAPAPVLADVADETTSGAAHFAIADNGTLAYLSANSASKMRELVWVDRAGRVERIDAPLREYSQPRISPDGKKILVSIGPGFGRGDVWMYDLDQGTLTQQTFGGVTWSAHWMPDQEEIVAAVSSVPERLVLLTPNSTSPARTLLELEYPMAISGVMPDGSAVLFWEHGKVDSNIRMVKTDGKGEAATLVEDPGELYSGVVSPDGKWLAYGGGLRTGEVFVCAMDNPTDKRQVSNYAGTSPCWSQEGRELFYVNPLDGALMSVQVETDGDQLRLGTVDKLFDLPPQQSVEWSSRPYDPDADGSRFLMVRPAQPYLQNQRIDLVLNWSEELRRLAPSK